MKEAGATTMQRQPTAWRCRRRPKIHLELGHLLKLTRRKDEAIAAYRDAERRLPDNRAAAELIALQVEPTIMVSREESGAAGAGA
jgi:hypothetical protein